MKSSIFNNRLIAILTFIAAINSSTAQQAPCFTPSGDFKELQRKFQDWKSGVNLNEKKGWKSFKRWESEMQLHCDFSGNPADATDYLNSLTEIAAQKNVQSRSLNTGMWYPVGPYTIPDNLTGYMWNGIGRVNCMAFHPVDSNTFFIGVAQGGLWKTTDHGNSYVPLTDQLPITRISDIAIDPQNPDVIYISLCDFEYVGFGLLYGKKRNTHYGLGVYKSVDGGQNWSLTGLNFQLTDGDGSLIKKIIIDPTNTSRLLACGVTGLYRSVDGGASWNRQIDSLVWDIAQDPNIPSTLYAAGGWVRTSNTGYAAIYKSTDFGLTWSTLNTGIPPQGVVQRIALAIAPTQPNLIYALAVDTVGGIQAIYRSDNGGAQWSTTSNTQNILSAGPGNAPGGQGTYDLCFLVDPANPDKIYAGGVNLWLSVDGGDTFDPASHWTTNYGPSIHGDLHELQVNSFDGKYYMCTDGGVFSTSSIVSETWNDLNNGVPFSTAWTNLNNGLNVTSFYRISSSKNSNNELIAGAQDNATSYYNGSTWFTVGGGDGMDNCLDTAVSGSFLISSQFGYFKQSNDGGLSYFNIDPNINGENGEWTTPIVADPQVYQTYYCGYENVTKSTDNGANWTSISAFPPAGAYGSELTSIALSAADNNYIYATRRVHYEFNQPGAIFRTTDGGLTWTDATVGVPDSAYYTFIEANPNDPSKAYVALAGLVAGMKVFMTADAGLTWTNISYNLPNLPVNCLRVLPGTNDLLAGTDIGLWLLPDGSTQWLPASAGLPNVIVSDIEFNQALNKIYVCTFGRGIWGSDLNVVAGINGNTLSHPNTTITIAPNPNHGSFELEIANSGATAIEIIDVQGRSVYNATVQQQKTTISSTALNPGLYFLVARNQGGMAVERFVVE